MTDTLRDLIERIEKLARPCRETDADIYEAIGFKVKRQPEKIHGSWRRMTRSFAYFHDGRWRAMSRLTASLDDACALMEQLLPGVRWAISRGRLTASEPEYGAHLFFSADDVAVEGEGRSAAIAIVIATLRAYAAARLDTAASDIRIGAP